MAKLVLDTNSLLQCIARRNSCHELWLSLLDGRHQLCVTTEILEEYAEILQRKTSSRFANTLIDIIINNPSTIFVSPVFRFKVIEADPDDNKFVDCAVAAKAFCIVTDDKHFSHLSKHEFPYVEVLKLKETVALLLSSQGMP
ncbi:MAG: putative toxin-antitoxin system toxin component, PIN family [Prevotella sp.]|nr:putative toxin-antitoxin system toxin component, PIN family [Prevotella sp.]